jgi:hypothetical protein
MGPGHEDIDCVACHRPEVGTLRQRLQANTRYLLGLRATPVALGDRPVGNEACLRCHERPNERHPVNRFMEPRFAKVRAAVAPQFCVSCHREHTGRRVTARETICRHCHQRLTLRKDPLLPTHATLVRLERWESCLRCHDFHGNHEMKLPRREDSSVPLDRIRAYFHNAESPYSHNKRYPARRDDDFEP